MSELKSGEQKAESRKKLPRLPRVRLSTKERRIMQALFLRSLSNKQKPVHRVILGHFERAPLAHQKRVLLKIRAHAQWLESPERRCA